jgi:hypothetical protein
MLSRLWQNRVSDLLPLAACTALHMERNGVSDMSPLALCAALRVLDMAHAAVMLHWHASAGL